MTLWVILGGRYHIVCDSMPHGCSRYGPREVTRREDFSMQGQLNCEFKYATFSCTSRRQHMMDSEEKDISALLYQALSPAVILVRAVMSSPGLCSGLHRQVGIGIVVMSGKPMLSNGSTLVRNARDVGSSPALATVFSIFITPMTFIYPRFVAVTKSIEFQSFDNQVQSNLSNRPPPQMNHFPIPIALFESTTITSVIPL